MLRSYRVWFLILLAACIATPYLLGVRPRSRRDWFALAIAIAFLMWLLLGLENPFRTR